MTLNLDKNRYEEAKNFSDQLHDLYKHGFQTNKMRRGLYRPLKIISQYSRLSEALILKISPRLQNKVNVQEILQNTAEERGGLFEIRSVAIINLCELFLFELKASGEKICIV